MNQHQLSTKCMSEGIVCTSLIFWVIFEKAHKWKPEDELRNLVYYILKVCSVPNWWEQQIRGHSKTTLTKGGWKVVHQMSTVVISPIY